MLDLNIGVRPDEVGHFYLQPVEPVPHWLGWRPVARLTWWTNVYTKDGGKAWFFSIVLFWYLQFYCGTAKCDASRSTRARNGEYGEPRPIAPTVVMTDLKKEMLACRLMAKGYAKTPEWTGMGSC